MKPLSSPLRWLLVLIVLSTATIAEAGVNPFWQSLGGSATGNGVSQTLAPKAVFEVSTAVGTDGRPVVTYVEYADQDAVQGAIVVKRWTGTTWQTLSGAAGLGQGYAPQIRISSTGVMNVAWLKDDASGNTEIRLRTATSTTWTPLGTSDSTGGIVGPDAPITAPFSLALDASGKPVVAFLGSPQTGVVDVTDTPAVVENTLQVYVMQWTGSAWVFVGSDFIGGGASNAVSFAVDPVTYLHYADAPTLAVDSTGAPVVAFTYNTLIDDQSFNSDVYAVRWTGAAWVALGSAVPAGDSPAGQGSPGGISNTLGGSFSPALAADTGGRLALVWEEESASGDRYVWVRVWNGVDAWNELAGSASGSGFAPTGSINVLPQIAVDISGPSSRPVVAWEGWTDQQAAPQTFVLRWNGTDAWEELGLGSASDDGISAAELEAFSPALALNPTTGVPTVAWLDARDPGSAQVLLRQFYVGPTFPLTIVVSGDGSVVSTPIGVECPGDHCITDFPTGTSVTLQPQGGAAGVFGSWSGACTGTGACTVAMTAARSVNASFVAAHTLAVDVLTAGGRVSSSPTGISACTDTCNANFADTATVTLTATADAGGGFMGWGGDCSFRGTAPTCQLAMSADRNVTASFSLKAYRLNVAVNTPAGTSGQNGIARIGGLNLDCGPAGDGLCSVDVAHGTHVFLQANIEAGNKFLNWTGGPCTGRTSALCDFTMTANVSTTALLRGVTGVQVSKVGSGTVTGPGINCGADCSEAVFLGALVTLTPTPAVGNTFAGWTGDQCDGQPAGACTFTAAGLNKSVTATFQPRKQRLAVTVLGNGSAVSAPAGIDCGVGGHTDCGVDLDYGTSIVLTPTADTDSRFSAWTGCTSLSGQVCTVSMTANRSLTLKFVAAHTLTVTASGNGGGKITTATAPGLTCVSNCSVSQLFPATAVVALTPAPTVGSHFNWVGGSCSGIAVCSLTMSANRTAVGQFTLNRHLLSVVNRPTGLVSSPAFAEDGFAFNCGSGQTACADTLNYGTPVTLQASASTGYTFVNWTGVTCAGGATSPTCAFVLKANTTATPNFRARTLVTVVKDGAGLGTVTSTGINCGADCSEPMFDGKPVILRAAPAVGSHFVAFGGACVSGTTSCTFVPAGDSQNVSATFALNRHALVVVNRLNGSVVSTNPLPDAFVYDCGNTHTDCADTLDYGTPVTLHATPVAGFVFVNWTGITCLGAATNTTCSFALKANTTVTPNYRAGTTVGLLKGGNGQGTLTATGTLSPATVSCGPACSSSSFVAFDGKPVTLRATASVGSSFVDFTGDCTSNTSMCTLLPSGASDSVTGTFVLQQFSLTVTNRGNGSVTSGTPSGVVDCGASGADCTETLDYSTPVSLTAVPNSGFVLVNWTGDAVCAGKTTSTCNFTVPNRNVTVTPNYRARTIVNVASNGASTDLVVSTPAGIRCPTDCSEAFFDGVVVKLTATAGVGKDFVGFSGVTCLPPAGNVSTPNVCSFIPTGNSQNISVSFAAEPRTANVSVTGNGQVTSSGFACDEASSPCVYNGSYGASVVFTAAPDAGQRLLSWTGCTSSNASTCMVLLTQASGAKNVTAAFGPIPAASISVGPGGQRSFGPNSVTITAGQLVEWTWESSNHNVVSGDTTTGTVDGVFCSPGDVNCATTPLSNAPTVYTHTFTTPGTYTYFCRAHRSQGMVATIVVNPLE